MMAGTNLNKTVTDLFFLMHHVAALLCIIWIFFCNKWKCSDVDWSAQQSHDIDVAFVYHYSVIENVLFLQIIYWFD